MTDLLILITARDFIGRGWCRGAIERWGLFDKKYDILGAVTRAAQAHKKYNPEHCGVPRTCKTVDRLVQAVHPRASDWNDEYSRTKYDVLIAFDAAIEHERYNEYMREYRRRKK